MAIASVNYSSPINVNGYSCRNCSEVELATKGIDPAHPQSGRNNKDAANDPTRQAADPVKIEAARRAFEKMTQQVSAYSPAGAIGGQLPPGSAFSLSA